MLVPPIPGNGRGREYAHRRQAGQPTRTAAGDHYGDQDAGLLCYAGGPPGGWSRVGPRASFVGVTGNRALARILTDDPHAWWITCFAVEGRHRRIGVGAALLAAAVDFAREQYATVLDGHPVDVDALRARRVSGSALFTGTMAMFVAAGFSEIGRTQTSRPVMRRTLNGS